jgi:hypothetical protein
LTGYFRALKGRILAAASRQPLPDSRQLWHVGMALKYAEIRGQKGEKWNAECLKLAGSMVVYYGHCDHAILNST